MNIKVMCAVSYDKGASNGEKRFTGACARRAVTRAEDQSRVQQHRPNIHVAAQLTKQTPAISNKLTYPRTNSAIHLPEMRGMASNGRAAVMEAAGDGSAKPTLATQHVLHEFAQITRRY